MQLQAGRVRVEPAEVRVEPAAVRLEPAEVRVEPAEVGLAVRVPRARPEVGTPVRLLLLPVLLLLEL